MQFRPFKLGGVSSHLFSRSQHSDFHDHSCVLNREWKSDGIYPDSNVSGQCNRKINIHWKSDCNHNKCVQPCLYATRGIRLGYSSNHWNVCGKSSYCYHHCDSHHLVSLCGSKRVYQCNRSVIHSIHCCKERLTMMSFYLG